jgi:hypothetical protein
MVRWAATPNVMGKAAIVLVLERRSRVQECRKFFCVGASTVVRNYRRTMLSLTLLYAACSGFLILSQWLHLPVP